MNKTLTKKVFLVEHDYHVDELIKRGIAKDCEWVALGPSAMYRLDAAGVPYSIPEDYCTLAEIERSCLDSYERLKRVCKKIDDKIMESDPFLKDWGVRPLFFHLWQIALVMDALTSRIIWLKKILNSFHGAEIYVFANSPQSWGIFDIWFVKAETLWGRLLLVPGWKNEIVILPEPPQENYAAPHGENCLSSLKDRVKSMLMADMSFKNIIASFRYNIALNSVRTFFPSKKGAILVLGLPYEWRYTLPLLSKSGIKIVFLSNQDFQDALSEKKTGPWSDGTEELWAEFANDFDSDDVEYISILKDRICWIIENGSEAARRVIHKVEEDLLKRNTFSLLIHCASTYFTDFIVKQMFLKKGIPVFNWQHGTVWRDHWITQKFDLCDMLCTTSLFTYGDKVTSAYESSEFNSSCKIKSIGNITLDVISKNLHDASEKGCSILYVITNYYRNVWYCGFSPPFSDRLYLREQRVIINALKEIAGKTDNVEVTIKLHSGADRHDDDPPWIGELQNNEKIKVKRHPGFVDMLNTHHIIIVDSPTTTLLEAIATSKPVFVLTSVVSPPRSEMPLLEKRAVCAESASELVGKLNAYVQESTYPADVCNREYLKLYGTHLDDGGSNHRIGEEIRKVVKGFTLN